MSEITGHLSASLSLSVVVPPAIPQTSVLLLAMLCVVASQESDSSLCGVFGLVLIDQG